MSENQTKETLDSVLADKAALSEQLAGKEQLLAELTSKNEALTEVVASLKQDKEDAQMQARKSELSEVLSDDKLDEVFSAVKGLDDASFSAIVSSYSSMKASVQESELMTEVGLGGENESESLSQESSLMQLIQKTNKGNK